MLGGVARLRPRLALSEVEKTLREQIAQIRVGDVADLGNFMGAVIDAPAYARIKGAIDLARSSPDAEILVGGCADRTGHFVEPWSWGGAPTCR